MTRSLPRRTFLRGAVGGAAVTLALPTLEAMLDANGAAHADGTPLPTIFGVWFWGNGILPARWVPRGEGAGWVPGDQLAPLADARVKPYVSVVTGHDLKAGAHQSAAAAILTGESAISPGANSDTVKGPSIDQIVAREIGGQTRFRSLDLGVHVSLPGAGGTVLNAVSHAGTSNPSYPILSPGKAFARLFGGAAVEGRRIAARRSVLDAVVADAASLRGRLGAADDLRLTQHLDELRAMERRLGKMGEAVEAGPRCDAPADPTTTAPDASRGRNLTEVNRIMSEILAKALACDLTRVFTFMFTNPAAHVTYHELAMTGSFHELCHNEPGDQPNVHRGVVYAMERFADSLRALRDAPVGAGNVLDRCAILATSDISDGKTHKTNEFPLVVAGRAGGALKHPGVHHRGGTGALATSVPLSLARAVGVSLAGFGGGEHRVTAPLAALLA